MYVDIGWIRKDLIVFLNRQTEGIPFNSKWMDQLISQQLLRDYMIIKYGDMME